MILPNSLPLIEIRNLSKHYDQGDFRSVVLKNIHFSVLPGELIAIVGTSGSGKSTLMNLIGLLDKPSTGDYLLNQRVVIGLSDDELAYFRNRSIGFVFQQFNLLPRFTVTQNVGLPLRYRGEKESILEKRVMEVLEKVGMAAYRDYYPRQLSGGQQQRIAIARALIGDPQLILADEPTGALDSNTGHAIIQLFLSLHAEGRTVIMVTHDERIAAQCPRQLTMADGEITHERQT